MCVYSFTIGTMTHRAELRQAMSGAIILSNNSMLLSECKVFGSVNILRSFKLFVILVCSVKVC